MTHFKFTATSISFDKILQEKKKIFKLLHLHYAHKLKEIKINSHYK